MYVNFLQKNVFYLQFLKLLIITLFLKLNCSKVRKKQKNVSVFRPVNKEKV